MEKYNFNQGELFTIRDMLEQLSPDALYEFINDAKEKIQDNIEDISNITMLIVQAKEVLKGYGEDYDEMKLRDL